MAIGNRESASIITRAFRMMKKRKLMDLKGNK